MLDLTPPMLESVYSLYCFLINTKCTQVLWSTRRHGVQFSRAVCTLACKRRKLGTEAPRRPAESGAAGPRRHNKRHALSLAYVHCTSCVRNATSSHSTSNRDIDLTHGTVRQYAVAVAEQRATRALTRVQRRSFTSEWPLRRAHCYNTVTESASPRDSTFRLHFSPSILLASSSSSL